MMLAAQQPDEVVACAPFYGLIPWEQAEPDWTAVTAQIRGHFAELDGFFGPDRARELEAKLQGLGKDRELPDPPPVSTTRSSTTTGPRSTTRRLLPRPLPTPSSSCTQPSTDRRRPRDACTGDHQ